jgi:deoxycytidine triphosphate deaminase
MILTDREIVNLCKNKALMSPYMEVSEKKHGVSAGPTPHGYDIRIGNKYQIPIGRKYINPGVTKLTLHDYEGGSIPEDEGVTISPNTVIHIESMETFNMPDDVTAFIMNKSTWQKLFIYGPNTIIDAGFQGTVTLAIQNLGPWPVTFKRGMGISHLVFQKSSKANTPYEGKYQNQTNPTGAIFK